MTYKELECNKKVWKQLKKSPPESPNTGNPMKLDHPATPIKGGVFLCWTDAHEVGGPDEFMDFAILEVSADEVESAAIAAGLDKVTVRRLCAGERAREKALMRKGERLLKLNQKKKLRRRR